jgi:hypothetical protein
MPEIIFHLPVAIVYFAKDMHNFDHYLQGFHSIYIDSSKGVVAHHLRYDLLFQVFQPYFYLL